MSDSSSRIVGVPADDLSYASKFADTCSEEVTRRGECQPCDRIAVAAIRDADGGPAYPVCSGHVRSGSMITGTGVEVGWMVPLRVLLDRVRGASVASSEGEETAAETTTDDVVAVARQIVIETYESAYDVVKAALTPNASHSAFGSLEVAWQFFLCAGRDYARDQT